MDLPVLFVENEHHAKYCNENLLQCDTGETCRIRDYKAEVYPLLST